MTKTIYVANPELWKEATDYAAKNGISMSLFIEQSLQKMLSENTDRMCWKCARIAEILKEG